MKGKYKAEYQLYEVDEKTGPKEKAITYGKDGYESIEELKQDALSLTEERIVKHGIRNGQVLLDLQIVELVGDTEVYIDNNSALFTIKDGKLTDIATN